MNLIIDNQTDTNITRVNKKITAVHITNPHYHFPLCLIVDINILYGYFLREVLNVYLRNARNCIEIDTLAGRRRDVY